MLNPDLGSSPPLHKIRILLIQAEQQQQICLHQLYSQTQYNPEKLDFTEIPFINFIYVQKRMRNTQKSALMAEGKPRSSNRLTKELNDSDTSEEEQVTPTYKTSKKERHYRTIHGLALATQIALSHSRAQTNPTT